MEFHVLYFTKQITSRECEYKLDIHAIEYDPKDPVISLVVFNLTFVSQILSLTYKF